MNKERRIQQQSPVEAEIPLLPQEIMVEILSRLPVKSLCQFRCVSKQWLSLISDPLLAKSHLKKTVSNDSFYSQRKRVIISSHNLYSLEYESIGRSGRFDENLVALELDYPLKDKPNGLAELLDSARDGFLYCERSEEGNDEFPVMVKLNLPFCVNQRNWVDILGSCNGLVCIAPDEDTLFLFNPSTRESKRIPDPPSGFVPNGWSVYGFGYDFVNDDYKVVKVGCGTVCVYSLRTDSWRIVCSFPYVDNVSESGVLLNGTIHWMVSFEDGVDCRCVVAAFSLEEEVFSDMPAPDIVDTSFEFVVGVLNGCLCVLHSRNQMHNDFWVMTEYGVGESWTKLTLSLSYICMKPLCLAQNREALLDVDGKLLLYNLEDDSYRYLVVDGIPAGDGFEADTYLETLVSPNGFCRT
ncbi:hypothetical protein E1A91_A09G066900v1 [Gossypium mustelinum]|uniref:F-box domain-containing protein n=1 Tax=Gossypium mustelinum TaxID=34275 RepID=A0A5D2XU77_GOSMU|nr:hypothetical protein E1A91_A09G066700v1 [Gossypium mustelinum]TYJ17650.1 hypothetical protein E1A91_A09G066900v1 [Gossypium mustelinum]